MPGHLPSIRGPTGGRAAYELWVHWKWPLAGRGPNAPCRSLAGSVALVSRIAARCGKRWQTARGKSRMEAEGIKLRPAPGSARLGDDHHCAPRGLATRLPRPELTPKIRSTHPARTCARAGCRLEAGFQRLSAGRARILEHLYTSMKRRNNFGRLKKQREPSSNKVSFYAILFSSRLPRRPKAAAPPRKPGPLAAPRHRDSCDRRRDRLTAWVVP